MTSYASDMSPVAGCRWLVSAAIVVQLACCWPLFPAARLDAIQLGKNGQQQQQKQQRQLQDIREQEQLAGRRQDFWLRFDDFCICYYRRSRRRRRL